MKLLSLRKRGLSPLFLIVTIIIALIVLPTAFIFFRLLAPPTESWYHIKEFLLAEYVINSLILVVGVSLFTGILGVFFAWSMSRYQWKHERLIEMLLFLPMAFPPYIAGYVYGGILTPFGTLYRLMDQLGLQPIKVDILSKGGAIFVFTLFLMPYVMLVTRSFFERMPKNVFESSLLLGRSDRQTFYRIILPMSRGALVGGVVLVALEVLNDYGMVKYFGIPTFSTAIYTTWFGMSDVDGAIRLAASLMVMVATILMIEQFFRGRGRLSQARATNDGGKKRSANKGYKKVFYTVLTLYLTFALVIPVAQLLSWSRVAKQTSIFRNFGAIMFNTLGTGFVVTVFVIVAGLLIGNLNRLHTGKISKVYARIVILGYSIPASIVAIAVLVFFISIDRSLSGIYYAIGFKSLFLSGSAVVLIFALTIRFMAIGFNNIEAGYSKMGKKHYEASKLLGRGEWATFLYVDFPILRPAVISAAILAFVDVLKELPLTLILRPFNFDTLATRVYTYAGDEMIHEASVYSLMIIAVSVVALMVLTRIRNGAKV